MAEIYSSSGEVSRRDATSSRMPARQSYGSGGRVPRTEYVYVGDQGGGKSLPRHAWSWQPPPHQQAPVPRPVPQWLGGQSVVGYAWLASMILVGFDEWKNNGILPRPARLWDTSLVFGLLALASFITPLIPLTNALAIGYTIMLLWQFYNGSGQFTKGVSA